MLLYHCRHFKEKGKKVSGLKQKEAAERRHALPDEAQGREAGTMDNGLHLQVYAELW